MSRNSEIYNLLIHLAIIGDVLYILFLMYNGIDEGFKVTNIIQVIAPLGLIFLLVLNIFLLHCLKK